MLHVEIREKPYAGTRIEIVPESGSRIPELRDVLERDFMIENPTKVFAEKMKRGEFEYVPKYKVDAEARIVKILSPVWKLPSQKNEEEVMNVMMVLSRLMQLYVNSRMELENLYETVQ